jgi:sarcosine oxidase subunit gamma
MSTGALTFGPVGPRTRFGLKGPAAAQWLAAQGLAVPAAANSWVEDGEGPDGAILVARLGTAEFFLEDRAAGSTLERIAPLPEAHPPGVYPVLRQDSAFVLAGEGSLEVLAQVCNVNFAGLAPDSRGLIMTLMIGVSVLVVPQGARAARRLRIWCDPTLGPYLGESVGAVVVDCGGQLKGESG